MHRRSTGAKDIHGKDIMENDTINIKYQCGKYSSAPDRKWENTWQVFWNTERLGYELKSDTCHWTPSLWSEIRNEQGKSRCEVVDG